LEEFLSVRAPMAWRRITPEIGDGSAGAAFAPRNGLQQAGLPMAKARRPRAIKTMW